jgi:hypothetical protein
VLSLVVLLIACLNVANILLVRVTCASARWPCARRSGPVARGLIRLLLIESLVLAVLGTGARPRPGRAISLMFVNSVTIGMAIPFRLDAHFDWRVFTYSAIAAIVTGLVVGALPARRASRTSITHLLHDGGRSGSASRARMRVRNGLVVAQVAGSLVLLIIAGLFVRNLTRAQQVDLGFDSHQVVTARLDTLNIGLSDERSARSTTSFIADCRRFPAWSRRACRSTCRWLDHRQLHCVRPKISRTTGDAPKPAVGCNSVSPEYFAALKDSHRARPQLHERRRARHEARGDRQSVPGRPLVAGPGSDRQAHQRARNHGDPWEVVGVVQTSKYLAVFETPLPYFFVPQAQNPSRLRSILVRPRCRPTR